MNADEHRYDDIINHSRHQSPTRVPMPLAARAAQFAPFAALAGYDAAIAEAGRVTAARAELGADAEAAIAETLRKILTRLGEKPDVTVTYFVPDRRKEGGAYVTHGGRLVKFAEAERTLVMADGARIPLDAVCGLAEKT